MFDISYTMICLGVSKVCVTQTVCDGCLTRESQDSTKKQARLSISLMLKIDVLAGPSGRGGRDGSVSPHFVTFLDFFKRFAS